MANNSSNETAEVEAYVALGSNMDEPRLKVRAGMEALAALPATRLECCSSLYRTAPVGYQAQPDFINAVCRVATRLPPHELMRELLDIERRHGRVRTGPVGGPRTLDLDLLIYGDWTSDDPQLIVPHPRLAERAFVLLPLHEIAPDFVVPGSGRVADLLARCADQRVERLAGDGTTALSRGAANTERR